jgi:predicted nucleic-acid-binding protein
MRAADTNVLLRDFVQDDATQLAAARSFIQGGAWVSHVVLAEFAWVLESVYERKPSDIARAVELLLAHESLVVHDAEVVAAALVSFRAKPRIAFSDHLILEIARKAGHLPLGTFDRDLGRLDGAETL